MPWPIGIHVVSVNRVGFEQNGGMKFWGGSFIANPLGTLLYKASHDQEEVNVLEVDLNRSDSVRVHWPFMRDRRIDSISRSRNGLLTKTNKFRS